MRIAIILCAVILAGCANTGAKWSPIIDKPNAQADADLIECQAHAEKVMDAGQRAMVGAFIGALMGAAVSSATNSQYRSQNVAIGAISGATGGGVSGETDQRSIIRKCMAGRGHTVLN